MFSPTQRRTTYSDGTGTLEFYAVPSFHQTAQGWTAIDPSVKSPAQSGLSLAGVAYSAEGAIRPIRFGVTSTALVTLALDGGAVVLSNSNLVVTTPTLDSSGAVAYANVASSTDLRYRVGLNGLKEEIVLKSSTAPHQFTFHISDPVGQLGGASAQPDGSYLFDGRIDSSVAVSLEPAVAYEQSSTTPLALDDPNSAHLAVTKAGDGFDVTVSIDNGWLAGKTYPIVLDPSLTFTDTSGTMSAYTDYNTTNGPGTNTPQTGNDLWTGTFTYPTQNPTVDYDPSRSFFYFNLSSIPSGSLVTYATLNMNVSGCVALGSTCAAQSSYSLDLHRLTGTWNTTTTWNQLSSITASNAFASISESGSRIANATSANTFWETWEVSQQVQRWVNGASNGGDTNYGFEVQIRTETQNIGGPYWCYQRTTYCVNQSAHPYLSVAYAAPSSSAGDQSATVNWSFSGQPSYANHYLITSFDTTTNQAGPGLSTPGSATSATLGGLTNTQTYSLQITGSFPWTGTGTNPGPAYVSAGTVTLPLAVASSVGFGGGAASMGQQVTYSITANNYAGSSLSVTSIADTLQSAFQVGSGPVLIDGSPCTTSPTCSISNGTLSIGSFTLAANASHTFTYTGLELGSARGCVSVSNAVAAVDANGTSHASSPLLVCDGGLGTSAWWDYVQRPLGPGSTAGVNVANGNLVVSQVDGTPIQGHGQLVFELKRVYNSQDTGNTNLPISASIGTGWRVMAGVEGPIALYVPGPATQISYPTGVLMVDSNGLRSQFRPRAGSFTAIDVTSRTLTGPLAALNPRALPALDSGYTALCVDTTFAPPMGVHIGLWRYIEVNGSCGSYSGAKVFGFAAMRLDRMRFEFSADGRLLDTSDGAGNDLLYSYDGQSRLTTISEPRCQAPNKCRSFSFSYLSNETDVTDPAGRVTKYKFTSGLLTQVVNPDSSASTLNYTYGSACSGNPSQLCSATDPNGGTTNFTYTPNYVSGGPPRIATVVDRRGKQTALTYANTASPEYVTSDQSGHRTRYMTIDSLGRITEVDEGDTSNNFSRQAFSTWDTTSASCRQPDNVMDNNLCQLVRRTTPGSTSATDESTAYVYNSEGRVIEQAKAVSSGLTASTTYGYHSEYFESGGTVSQFDDILSGNGAVTSQGSGARADAQTLFYVSDQTFLLPPRGNVTNGNVQALQIKSVYDNSATAAPANRPSGTVCPSSGTNTGLVCEVDGPYYDVGGDIAKTTYTYDVYGQKTSMKTPKANAESLGSYTYTYYDDSVNDLSGTVSAGGWLKATTDPLGNFAVLAYDAAGNGVQSWDRNSTRGTSLSSYPGGSGLPTTYVQDSYTPSGGKPWRYLLSHRDQLGDITSYTVDKNGNRTAIRPPRGNAAGNSSFDVTRQFDADDNLTQVTMPAEPSSHITYTYDDFGNQVEKQDQNGKITVYQYDTANRLIATKWTRDPWGTGSTSPAACRESTSSDTPLPAGYILCDSTNAYDGTDNLISSADGNSQTTNYTYDANHEETSRQIPRNTGGVTTVRADKVYDVDGNVIHDCPPREFSPSEGNASSCTATGYYSTHNTWDNSGRLNTVTTYRVVSGSAVVASYTYDADGNPKTYTDPNGNVTTFTYNALDKQVAVARTGQAGPYIVSYTYDPNGNQTAVTKPITSSTSQITAYSFDAANRPVDVVQGSSSTDATQAGGPDSSGGTNIRTRNAYDVDGHVVAVFPPNSFPVGWTQAQAPDARFMTRTDYDVDGRATATFQPRFDGSSYSDLGAAQSSTTQTSQCSTGNTPATISGIPAYPSGVGVCETQMSYDAKGELTTLKLPTYTSSNTARYLTYGYSDDGLLDYVQGPDPSGTITGQITDFSYLYDGVGNKVKTTNYYGFQQTSAYSGDNVVVQEASQSAGSNTHQFNYTLDANGNRTYRKDQANQQVQYDYYTDNKLRDWFDAMGNETYYKLDNAGNIIDVYQPSINVTPYDADNTGGTPIIIAYTPDNLPATVTEPVRPDGTLRRVTTYSFDQMGRRTQTSVQLGNFAGGGPSFTTPTSWVGSPTTQLLTYLNDSRVSVQTGRQNETITESFDPAGNVTSAVAKNGAGTTIATNNQTYYLDNSLRTADDLTMTSQYAYDGSGSVAMTAQVLDGVGNPNTYGHLYSYTDAGQLSQLSSNLMPSGKSIQWFYDHNGRLNQENFPSLAQASWTWNNDDTLDHVAITNSGGQTAGTYSYSYDSSRRILSQALTGTGTSADGTFSYGYDAASRLTSFTDTSNAQYTVSWDHDGNRLSYGSKSFTYNADDSMASAGSAGYSYNAIGLLTSDGCMNYGYDGFDRLSQVSQTGSCVMNTVNYAYDSFDRQISRSWSGGSTGLHYDGLSQQQVLERTTGVADTVYELARGKSVAVIQGVLPQNSVNTQYILDDGHDNAAFINNANSTTVCVARFDPWGSPYGSGTSYAQPCTGGSGTIDRHFYREARVDESTGNYQFGTRTYAPAIASFIEPDTYRSGTAAMALSVGTDPLTRNRYSYVNGDPVNAFDPSGHVAVAGDSGGCDPSDTSCVAADEAQAKANDGAGSSWLNINGYDVGQHIGNTVSALGGIKTIQPDKSQITWQNLGNAAAGWADQGVGSFADLACTASGVDLCSFVDTGGIRDHLVSGAINAAGGQVDTHSAAYQDGRIAFVVGSVAAGAPGLLRAAPSLVESGLSLLRAGSEAAPAAESAAPDLAETCAINSFTAGTLVLMADGSKRAIDKIKAGDLVMAGDPQKGTERAEPVKNVIVGRGLKHLVQIHVDGDVIDATYNHPFWSATNQKFEWAQDLKVGEQVRLADGRAPPIESIYKYDETTTAYNLSIQDIHTFFVGAESILVHNSCGPAYPSFSAARRAAFRDNNIATSEANNFTISETTGGPFSSNMRGPFGERPQSIYADDLNGDPVEIQIHSWGHVFDDTGEVMGPHLKGPDGAHYFY